MIKGLTDQLRLPRLGKVRLGVMRETKKGVSYPSETDYFVCPDEVKAVYGEQPKFLDVVLPVDDEEVVFGQAYKWYGANQGLRCKGDGETALRRYGLAKADGIKIDEPPENENDMVEIPCPCFRLNNKADTKNLCTPKGNLMVILPRVNRFGVYQIDIGSPTSMQNINSMFKILRAQLGRIAMIPLILRRVPTEMQYEDSKATHYLPFLECHLTNDQINFMLSHPAAPPMMIEAPHDDGPDPISPTPVEKETTPSPTNGNGAHDNKPWIETAEGIRAHAWLTETKDIIGPDAYYEILGRHGFEHRTEFHTKAQAKPVIKDLEQARADVENVDIAGQSALSLQAQVDAQP